MNRILRIFFHENDLFGERKRERLERRLRFKLNSALSQKKALEAVSDPEPDHQARLETVDEKIAELQQRLPRGDIPTYILLLLVSGAAVFVLYRLCHSGTVTQFWGSLDHPYLLRHRRWAVNVYKAGHVLASPLVFGPLLATIFTGLFFVQRRMQQRHARLLIKICTIILIGLACCFAAAFSRLLMLPLCSG